MTGTATDIADTLLLSELEQARPTIEEFRLDKAADAYACMMSGDARSAWF